MAIPFRTKPRPKSQAEGHSIGFYRYGRTWTGAYVVLGEMIEVVSDYGSRVVAAGDGEHRYRAERELRSIVDTWRQRCRDGDGPS
jgi:hypothetical protein